MAEEIARGPRRVYRGADVRRGAAVVLREIRRAEIQRAWVADYRIHGGKALAADAGENYVGLRAEFSNHIQEDPGAEAGLALFEGMYVAGAADIIGDYMDGEK
ncbi:hypothetical protein QF038_001800 [Pseudarthrobacter sp. W1I19]|uniref:hypothetical protein n=1 Tax=Pseudarthrobacter sp. W1I19 TaxID=3042288 RepID=UPI002782C2C1|nr:hypothetical protein [Pseudarthrobacter sp. W1I19]MDQ0923292.1 hypothetical protein [Pseudarthrobacter sp. W1I19]